jgi:NAD(P)-dependent dehydrogenase (short-subunit alcohol dehydrogenase family)
MGAYGAAKEAIRSLTRTAAREWAVDGIVVNCFCPVSIGAHREDPKSIRGMATSVLDTLRPFMHEDDPEHDIGPVVRFLCSEACHYLTGQTLTIDGGAFAFA